MSRTQEGKDLTIIAHNLFTQSLPCLFININQKYSSLKLRLTTKGYDSSRVLPAQVPSSIKIYFNEKTNGHLPIKCTIYNCKYKAQQNKYIQHGLLSNGRGLGIPI